MRLSLESGDSATILKCGEGSLTGAGISSEHIKAD
jgi:hypothetical protein